MEIISPTLDGRDPIKFEDTFEDDNVRSSQQKCNVDVKEFLAGLSKINERVEHLDSERDKIIRALKDKREASQQRKRGKELENRTMQTINQLIIRQFNAEKCVDKPRQMSQTSGVSSRRGSAKPFTDNTNCQQVSQTQKNFNSIISDRTVTSKAPESLRS